MKSKKLISLLCAAALTASSFASLAITASAAETVLWSDTFDSYSNSVKHQTNVDAVGQVLVDGTSIAKNEYAGIEGVTLITTDRADDSSYFKVTDDSGVGKALTTTISRFSNASRGAQILFGETYSPAADKDLVLAFKVKVENAGETTFDEAIQLNGDNTQEINFVDDLGIELGTWADVKIVITTSGTSVYVGDSTTAAKTLTSKSLSSIKFNGLVDGVSDDSSSGTQKTTSHPLGYPTISLDDAVVYTTAAGEGATATTPDAETHGPVDINYEVVPAGTAPEGLGLVASDNINNETTARLVYINTTEADSTYSALDTVILSCGTDTSTHSETKWSVVGNTKTDPALGTDKYLEAVSSTKSAANRGPKMTFKKGEIAERETVVAQFATRLHESDSSPAEVIFSGDLVASESKGNLSSPLAMITTDAEAASGVYACDNPLEQGGANVIEVPNNKWVLVNIEAYRSEGKTAGAKISVTVDDTTTYIFGSADAYADMKDSAKSGINTLPYVSFRSGNSTDYYGEGSGSDTVNDIDNIAVYSSNQEVPPEPTVENHNATIAWDNETKKATITAAADEEEAFDGVLIHAAYDSLGLIKSVKTYPAENITTDGIEVAIPETDTVYVGDKLMLWDSLEGMVPYGMATVEEGETPVQKYTITNATAADANGKVTLSKTTAEADEEITLTVTPDENYELDTLTVVDADNEVVAVTDGKFTMPAKNVTVTATFKAKQVAPTTYTVSGTVDENVDTVALTPETGDAINGTIAEGKVTFANVPAGTYTITVTAKTGYEVDTIKVADTAAETVTVADADVTTLAITTKQSTTPVTKYTVTVDSEITGGSVTADKTTDLSANDTVTLTVTPAEGNQLKANSLKVMNGETAVTTTAGENGTYTFAMPAANVTVTAEFEAIPAATYTVSGTVDAGVASVKLTEKLADDAGEDAVAKTYTGTIADTAVTFANVPAGTYTIAATAVSGKEIDTIKVADAVATTVTVTNADVTTLVITTKDEEVIPYAEGTITYENATEGAFSTLARVTSAVVAADTDTVNTTAYEKLDGNGGKPRAKYIAYPNDYPLTGDNVVASFDINTNIYTVVSIIGSDIYTGSNTGDENDDTNKVFSIGLSGTTNTPLQICKTGAVWETIENANGGNWYHVETVSNVSEKTVAVKVYNYKANNNYKNETPLYDDTVAFRDNTLNGIVGMFFYSTSNFGTLSIDNIYINDPSYVEPIAVTATGATVNKTAVLADDVITITPVVPAGQKLTAVKVNDTAIAAVDGAYTYTVTGEEEAIAVTAEFARADVTSVTVNGDTAQIQKGQSAEGYSATLKAGETEVTGDVTWTVVGATSDDTKFENGTLTIGADETAESVTLTATTRVDITVDSDTDNTISGTKPIAVVSEPVYNITKADATNGSFTVTVDGAEATTAKTGDTITVTPTAVAGYSITKVSYTPDGGNEVELQDNNGYTITGITADITVAVTFTAINYNITNATTDTNGSVAIQVDGAAAQTATVGQTVTIVPTATEHYKVASVVVKDADENNVAVTNNTFEMPASNVTVTVTFEEWNGVYYTEDFSTYNASSAITEWYNGGTAGGAGASTFVVDESNDNNVYLKVLGNSANAVRHVIHNLDSISVSDGVKISYDMNLVVGDDANGSEVVFGDSAGNVVFGVGTYGGTALKYYVGGEMSNNHAKAMTCDSSKGWGTNQNAYDQTTAIGSMTVDTTKWYHVELTITNGIGTLKVTEVGNDTNTATVENITINSTNIALVKGAAGKTAGNKGTKSDCAASIDNIKITASWYTGE